MNALLQSPPSGERRAEFGVAAQRLLLGAVPVALTAWLAYSAIRYHWFALDFYRAYYPAAHRLLSGASPYAVTHSDVVAGSAFIYPALSAVAFVPFALVSRGLSDHLYTLVCFLCVLGTLRAARVKDWRVYGVTLLWFPIIIGWQGQNVSVPLMFLVALVWRHRNRPAVAGLIAAAAISLKPFVWPLGLWLLATRRWTAAAWALGFGLALNVLAWGIVGLTRSTPISISRGKSSTRSGVADTGCSRLRTISASAGASAMHCWWLCPLPSRPALCARAFSSTESGRQWS